jgi:hypothetical protein
MRVRLVVSRAFLPFVVRRWGAAGIEACSAISGVHGSSFALGSTVRLRPDDELVTAELGQPPSTRTAVGRPFFFAWRPEGAERVAARDGDG